jgi:hydroxymethylglutaryl-CoA lyase
VPHIEVTNLGNPYLMPQFRTPRSCWPICAATVQKTLRQSAASIPDDLVFTAITIRESAVDRAMELRKKGIGPDRLLMMVSTEEEHHFANSGTTLPDYWKEAESAASKMQRRRHGEDVRHGQHHLGQPHRRRHRHEGCGGVHQALAGDRRPRHRARRPRRQCLGPGRLPLFFHDPGRNSRPRLHIAHFHETKRVASASVLAALQAGITNFEATLGGLGGSRPISWTTARFPGPASTTTTIRAMWG